MNPTLVLMLKAPVAGQVKTRLAADLGTEEACRIYRRLVEHQMGQIPTDWRVEIHYSPPEALQAMRDWLGARPTYIPQCAGDLGDRLCQALRGGAVDESRFPMIFLGGDCPYLDREALEKAGEMMQSHEVVVGPARDGGYVLLGMKAPYPELFREIAWSTEQVLGQTLERAAEIHLTVARMPELEDVDDLTSWRSAENYLIKRVKTNPV